MVALPVTERHLLVIVHATNPKYDSSDTANRMDPAGGKLLEGEWGATPVFEVSFVGD